MNWSRLKSMKCPKCQGDLSKQANADIFGCSKECGFFITESRFNSLVKSLYAPKEPARDNLAELNNFGRERMSDDFSDSPHLDI